MTHNNSLNVKLSNSQLIGNSDDKINFPHKLLLTNRKVPNLGKVFANYSSADISLSKTQSSKMIQSRGSSLFLDH